MCKKFIKYNRPFHTSSLIVPYHCKKFVVSERFPTVLSRGRLLRGAAYCGACFFFRTALCCACENLLFTACTKRQIRQALHYKLVTLRDVDIYLKATSTQNPVKAGGDPYCYLRQEDCAMWEDE